MHAVVLLQQQRCLMFCQLSSVAFDRLKQVLDHAANPAAAGVRKLGARCALLTCSVDLRHLACTLASFHDGGCGQAVCACAVYQACTSAAVGRRPFSARKARHLVAAAAGVAQDAPQHAAPCYPGALKTGRQHSDTPCVKRLPEARRSSWFGLVCAVAMRTSHGDLRRMLATHGTLLREACP